jgi:hypothetical protein
VKYKIKDCGIIGLNYKIRNRMKEILFCVYIFIVFILGAIFSDNIVINIMLLLFNIFVWMPICLKSKKFIKVLIKITSFLPVKVITTITNFISVKQYPKIISIIIVVLIPISISYLTFEQLFHISFVLIWTYLFFSLMYFSFIANDDDRDTLLEIWKLYFPVIVLMVGFLFSIESYIKDTKSNFYKTKLMYELRSHESKDVLQKTFASYKEFSLDYVNFLVGNEDSNKFEIDNNITFLLKKDNKLNTENNVTSLYIGYNNNSTEPNFCKKFSVSKEKSNVNLLNNFSIMISITTLFMFIWSFVSLSLFQIKEPNEDEVDN